MALAGASSQKMAAARNRSFHPLAREEALVGRAEAVAHSTRRVHISVRDPSPPRPSPKDISPGSAPPVPRIPPFFGQVGWQVRAGGGHARADSTVKMITHGAALLGPQGHDHPLGCRYLPLLGDAPQRDRGHHLGGRSSVWRSSRRGLACSSTSSSSDESFCTCLKHARNVMNLCSFMCRAELLAQQPALSGAVVFGGACAAV